jgi:hypothetical protein
MSVKENTKMSISLAPAQSEWHQSSYGGVIKARYGEVTSHKLAFVYATLLNLVHLPCVMGHTGQCFAESSKFIRSIDELIAPIRVG